MNNKNKCINTLQGIKDKVCIGCGRCETSCNSKVIKIEMQDGFYYPNIDGNCINCRACINSCMFHKNDYLEYKSFQNAFKGYDVDEEKRFKSASGGMMTKLMTHLFNEDLIDGVVLPVWEDGCFQYNIIEDFKVLDSLKGSVYTPVYYNDIWNKIKNFSGRVAFCGTSCWCEAIPKDIQNIDYIFGILCGHMPSQKYLEAFIRENSIPIKINDCKNVKFRGDGWPGGGYFEDTKRHNFLHTNIWSYQNFSSIGSYNTACLSCSDLWCKNADIVFADYWNPIEMRENKGWNLIVTNNNKFNKILNYLKESKEIHIEEVGLQDAISTQIIPYYVKHVLNKEFREFKLRKVNDMTKKLNIKIYIMINKYLHNNVDRKNLTWKLLNKLTFSLISKKAYRLNLLKNDDRSLIKEKNE